VPDTIDAQIHAGGAAEVDAVNTLPVTTSRRRYDRWREGRSATFWWR